MENIQTSQTTTNMKYLLSSAGALGGLYYAFKKNKGTLGFIGFFILGAIAGNLAGQVLGGVLTPVSASRNMSKTPADKNMGQKPSSATQNDEAGSIKGTPTVAGSGFEE